LFPAKKDMHRTEDNLYIEHMISKTNYIGVYRVNRAAQTSLTSIVDLKKLYYRVNLLIVEAQEAQKSIEGIDKRDFTQAKTNFTSYLQNQFEILQNTLLEKQKIIHGANRTLISNGIAQLAREYEIRLEKALEELKLWHRKEIDSIQDEISKYSKQSINKRSETDKYNSLISKTIAGAKRAGFDLQVSEFFKKAAINESRLVSISDTLDKMHAGVRSKEQTIKLLQEKKKTDLQKFTDKVEIEKKEILVLKPCTPKSNKVKRAKAPRPMPQEKRIDFDKVQDDFKLDIDEEIKKFEIQKKAELLINKESQERLKFLFMDLKKEVFDNATQIDRVKEEISPSVDFFQVAKILFPQSIKTRECGSQYLQEDLK
jgi:hypothetical protein